MPLVMTGADSGLSPDGFAGSWYICALKKQPQIAQIPQIKKHIALRGSPNQSPDAGGALPQRRLYQ